MSVSLRDTLVDILTYTPTTVAGRTTDGYVLGSTPWGRIERHSGGKTYLNGSEEQRVDATCAFGDDAVVDQKSLLRIQGTTDVFKVLAVVPGRRRLREIHVLLAQTDKAQYPGLP
jgi:hypothetical protein